LPSTKTIADPLWVEVFLEALRVTGRVSKAAKSAGITRAAAYARRARYAHFCEQWARAEAEGLAGRGEMDVVDYLALERAPAWAWQDPERPTSDGRYVRVV